jgi:hypothetical protein
LQLTYTLLGYYCHFLPAKCSLVCTKFRCQVLKGQQTRQAFIKTCQVLT